VFIGDKYTKLMYYIHFFGGLLRLFFFSSKI